MSGDRAGAESSRADTGTGDSRGAGLGEDMNGRAPGKPLFECVIPGRLVPKKNRRAPAIRGGRLVIRTEDRYRDYADFATWTLKAAWRGRGPLTCLVHVRVRYWPPDGRIPDLTGMLETVGDLLQGPMHRKRVTGLVIANDRQIKSVDGSRVMEPRPERPGVEIEVWAYDSERAEEEE